LNGIPLSRTTSGRLWLWSWNIRDGIRRNMLFCSFYFESIKIYYKTVLKINLFYISKS